ncbi:alpha/beta fold hydrolase [Massilia sp. CCM 8695]|uniref:Alpha/beta fold hydrolase n=1 Tax=Massilia frigida TaxID=2609281 RepID=A0ABX0NKM0_9BURK|nr:alpha/beta hydrolase [Massilia frigida]NHZ84171.1 alpha/beta fold hydrolase [Massilia frigida]
MSTNTILFVHGGPCSSAKFERLHLSHVNDIIWWDQPRENPDNPWPHLLSAAMQKLDECVQACGGPVHLLTSSFGAQIGANLACSYPEKVRSLVLLAPVFDVGAAYAGLAEAELAARPTDQLSKVLKGYRSCPSVETLWPMVGQLFAIPHIFERLLGELNRTKVDQFMALLGDAEMFDPHFFQITVNSFLATRECILGRYTGPVTAIFGRADSLVPISKTAHELQMRFPQEPIAKRFF